MTGFIVVPLLVLAAIMSSIANYFTYGIQIMEKSKYRLYLNLVVLALNLVLNLLLIPRYGILGAALATAVSFTCIAIAGMAISQRLYYAPYNWKKICSAGALVVLVSNFALLDITEVSAVMLVAKFMLVIIVTAVIARLLNIPLKIIDLSKGIRRDGRRFQVIKIINALVCLSRNVAQTCLSVAGNYTQLSRTGFSKDCGTGRRGSHCFLQPTVKINAPGKPEEREPNRRVQACTNRPTGNRAL